MLIVRPITENDREGLAALAKETGTGFTSMQDCPKRIEDMISSGCAAFADGEPLDDGYYLFVAEDLEQNKLVGTCAIAAGVGLSEPFYSYHLDTTVHASRELDVYSKVQTLSLSNFHTGCSEMCTLFLLPEARKNFNGHLLSKSRFLFMGQNQQRFDSTVIAEMRGFSDEEGNSPFWEGLGRHFFNLDFATADKLSMHDKVFIAELMPKNPIYTNLLPESAQEVIGHTHPHTLPARKLLESEGFRFNHYVDIFDAGPMLEAQVGDIRAVREQQTLTVVIDDERKLHTSNPFMLSNGKLKEFRAIATREAEVINGNLHITSKVADVLQLAEGDLAPIAPLFNSSAEAE
ncbi:arginine N-succinyltransferase [Vibrio ishigakensis]|uniref:Arginine N-succinyltransferase n=1 Tax=Vibrio ishigakensis TaxID=1481914 RepID=A0A0B8NYC4_9VIBR|nr:arginine N-succinyltransferase [Vibrio ishigakensis]GAM56063.1 arginine N-succinyltransferase [Vibrio ishigakensis]GAM75845.1 arginine N-succinyltransferase [Vibrio ishigakensis]